MNINFNPYTNLPPHQTTNFKGSSRVLQCELDKALLKKNLSKNEETKLIQNISEALDTIIISSKFIEEGSHNAVYKITQKYAARVPINWIPNSNDLGDKLKLGRGLFAKLKNYFGEAVVELGKLQILPNVGKHIPAGVPEHLTRFMKQKEQENYYINKYLPKFADIPQASYNEIAQDIEKLNEIKLSEHQYCVFDYLNPNNIVTKGGRLFLVDEIDTLQDKSYMNTTAKLLNIFINRAGRNLEAPFAANNLKYVRKIFQKVIIASVNANMLPANSKEDYKLWEKALKKCNIKTEPFEVIDNIERLSYSYKNPDERVQSIKNYLNKLFIENPIKNNQFFR